MEQEIKEKNIFEIDGLIKETYNKIATWHNENPDKESLKQLSLEIIEYVSKAAFNHIGVTSGDVSIYKDEETAKKIKELKKQNAK